MTNIVIIGAQFGDCGKGKIVNFLAKNADCVVRYNGGDNAGHTVVIKGEIFRFHLLPSGTPYPNVLNVIGNGVVVNPQTLATELDDMNSRGYKINGPSKGSHGNLLISENAHIIMPWHIQLDKDMEEAMGDKKIGTTQRGIGPTYMSKAGRTEALRACDIVQQDRFEKRVGEIVSLQRNQFENKIKKTLPFLYQDSKLGIKIKEALDSSYEKIANEGREVYKYCEKLKQYVGDSKEALNEYLDKGKTVIFEGAQGTLLDIDHGTYPDVTSSNATIGGAFTGTGVSKKRIDKVIGVAKAYTTRVGSGAFPTELTDKVGEMIRNVGHEFGTTTGRPRRVGWMDTVILKYASLVSGFDGLALMKFDVLSGLDEIKICHAYEIDGKQTTKFPTDETTLKRAIPVYETMKGWKAGSQDWARYVQDGKIPTEVKAYLDRIYDEVGVPVKIVSVGPERDETIVLEKL